MKGEILLTSIKVNGRGIFFLLLISEVLEAKEESKTSWRDELDSYFQKQPDKPFSLPLARDWGCSAEVRKPANSINKLKGAQVWITMDSLQLG